MTETDYLCVRASVCLAFAYIILVDIAVDFRVPSSVDYRWVEASPVVRTSFFAYTKAQSADALVEINKNTNSSYKVKY